MWYNIHLNAQFFFINCQTICVTHNNRRESDIRYEMSLRCESSHPEYILHARYNGRTDMWRDSNDRNGTRFFLTRPRRRRFARTRRIVPCGVSSCNDSANVDSDVCKSDTCTYYSVTTRYYIWFDKPPGGEQSQNGLTHGLSAGHSCPADGSSPSLQNEDD